MVMKSAEDRPRCDAADVLDGAINELLRSANKQPIATTG
jgi:hypothetical protein